MPVTYYRKVNFSAAEKAAIAIGDLQGEDVIFHCNYSVIKISLSPFFLLFFMASALQHDPFQGHLLGEDSLHPLLPGVVILLHLLLAENTVTGCLEIQMTIIIVFAFINS